ncbi:MAG: hypothetical protein A2X11_12945 [Bacteroidetes bacterium GWE2_42_24]|nr:MAG: hypothetical protein A2X11_12945 [Bacteroidetes bacterium GWE2_42_24]OFY32349.1 MAG: hypothetical protein A2X09_13655 [Bacteroidetes bacterium GWF2_43_11]HCT84193.1 hypothetical protein [Candidatus Margulisiibacteriota bacterium]
MISNVKHINFVAQAQPVGINPTEARASAERGTGEESYYKSIEKELDEFCDDYFANDTKVEEYCRIKYILT